MEDVYAGITVGSKPLSSLRVIDLKSELEKRGLSKSGSKKDLQERLKRQLQLERLQESAPHNADRVPNLSLQDDATQNEVVKQYLAAQQKTYEIQKEARRQIELSADEVGGSETDASSSQDEGLSPLKSSVRNLRAQQTVRELKESEVVSSEVEEAEDLSEKRSQHVDKVPEVVKQVQKEKLSPDKEANDKIDENLAQQIHSEEMLKQPQEQAENLTMSKIEIAPPEVQEKIEKPEEENKKSAEVQDNVKTNRLVNITESEMSLAIESISGVEQPSYPTAATENIEENQDVVAENVPPKKEQELNVQEPMETKKSEIALPVIDKSEKAESPRQVEALEMVKQKVKTPTMKSEPDIVKREASPSPFVPEPDSVVKKKLKSETAGGDQPMDLSFEENQPKTENIEPKLTEGETLVKSENVNGSKATVVKTETATAVKEMKRGRERKHSSDTEEESQESPSGSRSRSRSKSSNSRSRSRSSSGSGSFSSPQRRGRKKRVRNTDSEASSSSDEESNQVKRRGSKPQPKQTKTDASSPDKEKEATNIVEPTSVSTSSQSNTVANKRRKWTNTSSTESTEQSQSATTPAPPSAVERRKINRTVHPVSAVEPQAEEKSPIESPVVAEKTPSTSVAPLDKAEEEQEDASDKKDTLVLDIHVTDETMGVSDTEKDLVETKPPPPKKKITSEKTLNRDSTSTVETSSASSERVKKITNRKISLSGSSTSKEEDSGKPQRKRKWGSITKVVPVTSPVISTESLKGLIPDLTPALTAVAKMEDMISTKTPVTKETSNNNAAVTTSATSVASHKIEMSAEEASGGPREVSPPRKPVSTILYVRNLVRPFTLNQLKEELGKNGTLVEEGFWIDKIKSKCYVTYETEDQAVATRKALHGARWPASNPKTLFVDFSNQEELDFQKGGGAKPIPPSSSQPKADPQKEPVLSRDSNSRKISESERSRRISTASEDKKHVERGGGRGGGDRRNSESSSSHPQTHPIREWDRDKIVQEDRGRNRDRQGGRNNRENDKPRSKDRKERGRDKKVDNSSQNKKKQEEETPGKLLDDLFRKTKAVPCIYWLPLTEQQIVQRDEQKKQRLLEREQRRKRIEMEEREKMEAERKMRLKERDIRMNRDRNIRGRSRSASRSPIRRR